LNYQYKLKLNKHQAATIDEWLQICRAVYNFAFGERKDWAKSRACQIDRCSIESEYIIPADLTG